jgi:4-diphosphocytidyl-2-C-methyl-D-erythritol kinase
VLGLRADGYHELAMVMQSLDLADTLHLWPTADGQITLSCDDPNLPTDGGNLIVRAAELLRSRVGVARLGRPHPPGETHPRRRRPGGGLQ